MKFKVNIIMLFFLSLFSSGVYAATNFGMEVYKDNVIDASNNARFHNNLGNIYFEEKNYIAALSEYELAFNLSYDNNLSATYLYNIARCYMTLERYALAKNALLGVIKKNCMNIVYYEALVDCFINLKIEKKELEKYLNDNSNPYNKIISGLIYLKTDDKRSAKIIFDEFIVQNPDMLITDDIKRILKKL